MRYVKKASFLLIPTVATMLSAAGAAQRPPTVVPICISTSVPTEEIVSTVRGIHEQSGISQFVLHAPGHGVRISGYYDAEGYRGVGRRIRAVQEAVANDGIEVGFLMGPTMNVGSRHPWQTYVRGDGSVRAFTACAGDPAFRQAFAERCAALAAECRPFLFMMEDDYRFWGAGCFCTNHLARFSHETGTAWTRETLARALAEETNTELRVAWEALQSGDLLKLAADAERAIHAVSPATRIGLSGPGGMRNDTTARIARTLAGGRHRPLVRWWGTSYGYDYPLDVSDRHFSALWSKENVSEGMDCYYEADACPNTAFYGSGARLGASCSSVLAAGFHGLWYWAASCSQLTSGDPMPNLEAYRRASARWAALAEAVRDSRTVGVSVAFNPLEWLVSADGATQGHPVDAAAAARLLGRMGLAYTTRPGNVTAYAGYWAFEGMSDAEIGRILAGNVFLDGEAAEALTRRGFSEMIGVTASRRERIDFTGEYVPTTKTKIESSFHANYGLDGATVLRLAPCGAETVSHYFGKGPDDVVQPAIARFVNAKGGRVVTMAVALARCSATNVYNFQKRALLVDVFEWLGGKDVFPVRTDRDVNVVVTASETKCGAQAPQLVVHAVNLSCDVQTALSLVVAERWRGASVEILDGAAWRPAAEAVWDGARLTVPARLGVFDTLIIRLSAASAHDVVIYGSSPAAISAAIQAKRMGKSAVIVSPETRIGGLTTGGLGQTDIGNKSAFGGIALEFYRAVADYYRDEANWKWQRRDDYLPDGQCAGTKGADSMWTFEPSAALKILEDWERRDGLEIHRGKRLDRSRGKVKVRGEGEQRKILSFMTEDGTEYWGKMFVDATYEGDLMAAAGVSYFVGREANAVYGETISGNAPAARGADHHNFNRPVSAYVVKGDRSSGLLPGVEPYDPDAKPGDGDRRVQAYCFRMCLTDVPANRIPFKKPAGYDARDYELLLRNYEAGERTDKMPWINSKMPNRKTDTNNRFGFSTDFIGGSWSWPEASYAERGKILAAHLKYQQGLMWTLANHPRVPQAVRDEISKWGTCRDEFDDGFGDGWQRQLYVREARRLVGDCVMTENHCRGVAKAARPVAMGAYGMDSHHCRRVETKDGLVRNEGNVEDYMSPDGKTRFPPFGIDYGALIPKRGECANLFVPVCLSASHVAFGSIRMEPVFFALGQVAGTAAAQAIDAGRAVQDLDYATLRERLLADGQRIVWEPADRNAR